MIKIKPAEFAKVLDYLVEACSQVDESKFQAEDKVQREERAQKWMEAQTVELRQLFEMGLEAYAEQPECASVSSRLGKIVDQLQSLIKQEEIDPADVDQLLPETFIEELIPPAEAAMKQGNFATARQMATVAIVLYPLRVQGYATYLFCIENEQGTAEACRQYEMITQLYPDPLLLFYAAECEERNKNPGGAAHYLSRAAEALEGDEREIAAGLRAAVSAFQSELA